jgi:hypothetical protein
LKSPDNCHKLIIDPETAPVVRQIFDWAYDKIAVNDIVVRLNEAQTPTPSHYKKSRNVSANLGSGKWQTRTINVILSSEVYVGDMVQGKTKIVNGKQVHVDESDWIVVKNTHEAVVSREMFEAVKALRARILQDCGRRVKVPYTENIFKGKIFCGCCGKNLHRRRSGNNTYYIRCITNERVQKGLCDGLNIPEKELTAVVSALLLKKAEALVGDSLFTKRHNGMRVM